MKIEECGTSDEASWPAVRSVRAGCWIRRLVVRMCIYAKFDGRSIDY